jgi:RNA polymerase sigma-70 factor (ECF subfamily)
LYEGIDDEKAKENFEKALSLAKTENERQTIKHKMENL